VFLFTLCIFFGQFNKHYLGSKKAELRDIVQPLLQCYKKVHHELTQARWDAAVIGKTWFA